MPTEHALRAWVDWVLGSLMAELPFAYSAVLVSDASVPGLGLRLAGERRGAGAGEPACRATADGVAPSVSSLCGSVFLSGTPALVADVRKHPGLAAAPDSEMRSGLVVPVVRDGRPIGVINVESPRVGGLGIADLEALTLIATEAAGRAPASLRGRAVEPPH